jgi:hypothetical protein
MLTAGVAVAAALAASPRLLDADAPAMGGSRRIGVLCRIADSDGVEASAHLRALCNEAVGILARRAPNESGIDGPVILIASEPQPPWAGGARPRVRLRVLSAWSGWRLPVIGAPSMVIDPAETGWLRRTDEALGRIVDSLAADG